MIYLFFVWVFLLVFSISFWIRNDKVSKERMVVLELISTLAWHDIGNRNGWEWRYEEFETISYAEMLWKFWIPIEEFYKDHPCLSESKGE